MTELMKKGKAEVFFENGVLGGEATLLREPDGMLLIILKDEDRDGIETWIPFRNIRLLRWIEDD